MTGIPVLLVLILRVQASDRIARGTRVNSHLGLTMEVYHSMHSLCTAICDQLANSG